MCGWIGNVTDSPLTRALLSILGMEELLPRLRDNPGSGPASSIDIIIGGQRPQVVEALWWLLLERQEGCFRPSKYTSFNTRSDRLDEKRSVGYLPYRRSRCLVPASYFIEGTGPKGRRLYHRIEPGSVAFALGGLYRAWVDREGGEVVHSCSIITLPPHPGAAWQGIHPKSTPLMLPADPEVIGRWLDPEFDRVEEFEPLLEPRFRQAVRCVPVERPGNQRQIGETVAIDPD